MRLAIFFLALAAVVLGSWWLWGGAWENRFSLEGSVAWLESAGPWAWAAGIGLLMVDLFLPIPGTVVMSALGFLYGAIWGGCFAATGSFLAGLCGYGLGRLFGENFSRRWLGNEDFEKGKHLFSKRGGWVIALSRALPILPEVLSCTAGLVRMPFGKFSLALACGSVPMGFIFAAIGAMGRDTPMWAMLFSLLFPGLLWLLARRFQH
jgi:uncharacterized membrane protein YdjX (TVP38/TMEM64 family)